jgi:hypothetical protein
MTASTARPVRKGFALADAWREFWKHPSPWMIGTTFGAASAARFIVGDWQFTDAVVPLVMIALFPFFEWIVHVFVLHWRPKHVGRLTVDPLLARKHREHHVNPRDIALIFIPWRALLWVLPLAVAIAVLAFPRLGLGLTYLVLLSTLGLAYEWCHYLIHSDYKPKTAVYRAIWLKSPPAPLQERALLVHGHQFGYGRPGVGDLPGSHHGRHFTDREEPARPAGGTAGRRYDCTMTGSPIRTVSKYQAALAGLRLMQPWLTFA